MHKYKYFSKQFKKIQAYVFLTKRGEMHKYTIGAIFPTQMSEIPFHL